MDELFSAALLRLKEQTGLHTDREVADLLGLGEKAFNARKSRNSFPEDKLFALKAQRPDLDLDVAYVLTGERQLGHARAQSDAAASFAGTQQSEAASEFAAGFIRVTAEQERRRKPQYQLLRDLAGHCDDKRLHLLVQTAEAFRLASASAAGADARAAGAATKAAGAPPPVPGSSSQVFHAPVGQAVSQGDIHNHRGKPKKGA